MGESMKNIKLRTLFLVPPLFPGRVSYMPRQIHLGAAILQGYLRSLGYRNFIFEDMEVISKPLLFIFRFLNIFPYFVKILFLRFISFMYNRLYKPFVKKFLINYIFVQKKKHSQYFILPKLSLSKYISKEIDNTSYIYKQTHRLLHKHKPNLLALSALSYQQLYYSFTIAKIVKKLNPDVKILVGGPFLTKDIADILKIKNMNKYVDFFVVGDGEEPLRQLITALDKEMPVNKIPNLYYKKGKKYVFSSEHYSGSRQQLDIIPDYSGMLLYDTVSFRASIGCYWGKCVYCSYPAEGHICSFIPVEKLVSRIEKIQRQYKVYKFHFRDDALPPAYLKRFSRALLKKNIKISWTSFVCCDKKFDPETASLMKKAGCSYVIMGLETMSPRLLKLMKKIQKQEHVISVLKCFSRVNIDVHLCVMFGFPSETKEEAEVTRKFLVSHKQLYKRLCLEVFNLDDNSPMFTHLEQYGIRNIKRLNGETRRLRGQTYTYKTDEGMTRKEAMQYISILDKECS